MKMKRTAMLGLLFSAIFASMVLTSTVTGDTKHFTFSEPVIVGNVTLEPGTYRLEWTGSGPEVKVSFLKEGKLVAIASAMLIVDKSPHRAIETITMPDNSKVLKRISFTRKTLVFTLSSLGSESRAD
jgi:hypothetical protein